MKKIIALVLSVIMVFSLAGCANGGAAAASGDSSGQAPQKVVKWTMQTMSDQTNFQYKLYEKLVKDVEVATNGRLKIELHPVGSIVDFNDCVSAVQSGTLDMTSISASALLGLVGPKTYLLGGSGGPGAFSPQEQLAWVYAGDGEKIIKDLLEPYGMKYLAIGAIANAEAFAHSNKKLESIEDFKGVKFRTMGMWAEILQSIGAEVVNIPGAEIYQSADRGIIDAFEYVGPQTNWDMGYQEIAKYIELPGIHSPICTDIVVANPDSYSKLPDDVKQILYQTIKAMGLSSYMEHGMEDAKGLQNFKDYGTEVVILSEDTQQKFVDLTYKFHEKFMGEDPQYKEIFMNQKDFIKTFKTYQKEAQPAISVYDK